MFLCVSWPSLFLSCSCFLSDTEEDQFGFWVKPKGNEEPKNVLYGSGGSLENFMVKNMAGYFGPTLAALEIAMPEFGRKFGRSLLDIFD